MAKLIAIHAVHLTTSPGKVRTSDEGVEVIVSRPKTIVVKPGTIFEALNAEEDKYLRDAGAARRPTESELAYGEQVGGNRKAVNPGDAKELVGADAKTQAPITPEDRVRAERFAEEGDTGEVEVQRPAPRRPV